MELSEENQVFLNSANTAWEKNFSDEATFQLLLASSGLSLCAWNNKYTEYANKWICGYVIGIGGYKTRFLTDPEKRSRCLFGTGCVFYAHVHFSQQRFLANADRSPVVKPSSGAQPPWIRLYEKKAVCANSFGKFKTGTVLPGGRRGEHGKFPPSTRHMTKNVFFKCENDAGNIPA
ncbi:MAG: hypothetical protein V8R40_14905 [Dysosmobacter sp.]